MLAQHFLSGFNKKLGKNSKGFTKKALKYLYEYNWPGNVREMENTIERCMIICEGDMIDVEDLPVHLRENEVSLNSDLNSTLFTDDTIVPFEKLKEEAIKHALKTTSGNIVEAAKKLQLGRATIYRLMEKYNIINRQ